MLPLEAGSSEGLPVVRDEFGNFTAVAEFPM